VADHVAKQLRAAVISAVTGLATTGANVFGSRVYPVRDAEIPCLLVYTPDESAEDATLETTSYQRRIAIRIEALAKATASLEDTLDQIRKEVEIALAAGVLVGGWTVDVEYRGMTSELRDDLEKPVGSAEMSFEATLFTAAASPDVIIGA
jgi:hypothetical protein